jgi:hypothetical protein
MAVGDLAEICDLPESIALMGDHSQINAAITAASAAVTSAAGSPIKRMTSTVLLWSQTNWLRLPGPVRSLTSVSIDGSEVTDFVRAGDQLWRAGGWGSNPISGPCMVQVVLDHGLDEVPADIKDLVCQLVGLSLAPGAVRDPRIQQVRIDDFAETSVAPEFATVSVFELPERTRVRLRERFSGADSVVVSVAL